MSKKLLAAALIGAAVTTPAIVAEAKFSLDARYDSGVQNEDGGTTEIVAYNPHTHATYVVNGETKKIEAISLNYTKEEAMNLKAFLSIDIAKSIATFDQTFEYGDLTSITVHPKENIIAVSVQAKDYNTAGYAVVLTGEGKLLGAAKVGSQPDNITFTTDGTKLLTANEGEPREGYGKEIVDPKGSISVIDTTNGYVALTAETLFFDAFDTPEKRAELVADNVIIKKNTNPSDDLEPEYITVNEASTKAYVALQENNAIATIDLTSNEVVSVKGLGFKDHSKPGNEIDLLKDGKIDIKNENYFGIYMPDGLATVTINGKDYLITANEGDGREWGDEDSENFHLNEIETEEEIVTYDTSGYDGFVDGQDYIFGARSFAIFEAETMDVVFESGSDFETITAQHHPEHFNASNTNVKLDNRSGKKGPEPEDVKVGKVGDDIFAYIGLERIGGVMMYNITNPASAKFVDYLNLRDFSDDIAGDVSPEGMAVITKDDKPQLIVGHEVSGTVTVLNVTEEPSTFKDIENQPDKEAIDKVTKLGIFNGVNETTFAPNKPFNRSHAALVLHRLAGTPASDVINFNDVLAPATQAAVSWTVANQFISPLNNKVFGAGKPITREEFAVAVYNTLKANGQITASEAPAYMDDAKISAHAKEAVASLKAAGIMTGIDNEFNPKQSLTRAQAAVVLNKIVD